MSTPKTHATSIFFLSIFIYFEFQLSSTFSTYESIDLHLENKVKVNRE